MKIGSSKIFNDVPTKLALSDVLVLPWALKIAIKKRLVKFKTPPQDAMNRYEVAISFTTTSFISKNAIKSSVQNRRTEVNITERRPMPQRPEIA